MSCLRALLLAFVCEDEVVVEDGVGAGREAAATLARIVVRFLPFVGACGVLGANYRRIDMSRTILMGSRVL